MANEMSVIRSLKDQPVHVQDLHSLQRNSRCFIGFYVQEVWNQIFHLEINEISVNCHVIAPLKSILSRAPKKQDFF